MIDNEHRLQTKFSDEEANARITAWDMDNGTLRSYDAGLLIQNIFEYYTLKLVEVDFSHIWMTPEIGPSYESATSSVVQITLSAKCNESAMYIGDLTETLVRGASNQGWIISRIFHARSITDQPELMENYKVAFIEGIKVNAAVCNEKIRIHRDAMLAEITKIVMVRVAELQSSERTAEAANIRLKPLSDPIIIPLQPKSLNIESVRKRKDSGHPIAGLADEIANELVRTLRAFALALERQPVLAGAMLTKNEEALRDVLLFILNSQWGGIGTAETFLGRGKTDVLIRWENADAFIAECKMWRGPQSFTEGIDQLLGYTVWRDTRVGLILFIRDKKNVTAVIESAVRCIIKHPNFTKSGTDEYEYVMHSEHDDKRYIRLSLIPIHIQADNAR